IRVVRSRLEVAEAAGWGQIQQARAADQGRNLQILRIAAAEAKAGRKVAVLVDLIQHARLLASALTRMAGIPAYAVIGEVPMEVRTQVKQQFMAGHMVIVATKLFDEGLDLPPLEVLILATPGRAVGPRLLQQIGRTMRISRGKTGAVVYDVQDPLVPSLARQAAERLKQYRDLGMVVRYQQAE
ncbi:MAG: DEAD/DEAH box helicase, partial [Actinomycetes bacterium]